MADLPDGVSLAYSHWGEPKSDTSLVAATGLDVGSVSPAVHGLPYRETPKVDRSKKCTANNDTCNGWRLKNSELCAGHGGVLKPYGAA